MGSVRDKEKIQLLKIDGQAVMETLKANLQELEVAVKSRVLKNVSFETTKKVIRAIDSCLKKADESFSQEEWEAEKKVAQAELNNNLLMLGYADTIKSMHEKMASYKAKYVELREAEKKLKILSGEMTGKKSVNGPGINGEESELFYDIHNTITKLLQDSASYSNNGFEDALGKASDMKLASIESLRHLQDLQSTLNVLSASMPTMINSMSDCITLCIQKVNEQRNKIRTDICNALEKIKSDVEHFDTCKEYAFNKERELGVELPCHFHIELLSHSIAECRDEYKKIVSDFNCLQLEHVLASELYRVKRDFNGRCEQLASRTCSGLQTMRGYVDIVQEKYNEKALISKSAQDQKMLLEAKIEKLKVDFERKLLDIEKNVSLLSQLLGKMNDQENEILVLHMQMNSNNIYFIRDCHGVQALTEMEECLKRKKQHAGQVDVAINASACYKTHIAEIKSILGELGKKNITAEEVGAIQEKLSLKEKAIQKNVGEIRGHVENITDILKYRESVLQQTKEDMKNMRAALNASLETLPDEKQAILKKITDTHTQEINRLNAALKQCEDDKKILFPWCSELVKKIKDDFNLNCNTLLSDVNQEIAEDSKTLSSQWLTWLSSWIPFVKNSKKDELVSKKALIQTVGAQFNRYCDQLSQRVDAAHLYSNQQNQAVLLGAVNQQKTLMMSYQDGSSISRCVRIHSQNIAASVSGLFSFLDSRQQLEENIKKEIAGVTQKREVALRDEESKFAHASFQLESDVKRVSVFIDNVLFLRKGKVVVSNKQSNKPETDSSFFGSVVHGVSKATQDFIWKANDKEKVVSPSLSFRV